MFLSIWFLVTTHADCFFCPLPQPYGLYQCHLSPLCVLLGDTGHIWLLSCGILEVRGTFGGLSCPLLFRFEMQPLFCPYSLEHARLRKLGFCNCLRPCSEKGRRIPYSQISRIHPELCFSLPGLSPTGGDKAWGHLLLLLLTRESLSNLGQGSVVFHVLSKPIICSINFMPWNLWNSKCHFVFSKRMPRVSKASFSWYHYFPEVVSIKCTSRVASVGVLQEIWKKATFVNVK